MNFKIKDIIILAAVFVFSFPVTYFAILLVMGNARVEFGEKPKDPEVVEKVEIARRSEKAESLAVVNSRIFQANKLEQERVEKERESLQEARKRLELYQNDLEAQKAEVKKEREKIETLVEKSETLDKKKTVQLAKMYSAMRPAEAAQIIETLNDDLAMGILQNISDDRQKAKILSALSPEKATRITTLMGTSSKQVRK
ncbi:MAG: hypothetical protein MUF22_08075 [Chitinispirillaceae bacterium]|jgi:flagellar motility protein MotE (MotC chaperone)|nr:hypothetical protein [Chitinispirillaceae bacterium]